MYNIHVYKYTHLQHATSVHTVPLPVPYRSGTECIEQTMCVRWWFVVCRRRRLRVVGHAAGWFMGGKQIVYSEVRVRTMMIVLGLWCGGSMWAIGYNPFRSPRFLALTESDFSSIEFIGSSATLCPTHTCFRHATPKQPEQSNQQRFSQTSIDQRQWPNTPNSYIGWEPLLSPLLL